MGIGLTEDHEALAASVRGFAERNVTSAAVRTAVDREQESRPDFWPALAGQGLLGLHVPEEYGGQGFGLMELAVAVEELGRVVAPGPYLPTVLASSVILAANAVKVGPELLPRLADGRATAAVSLATGIAGRPAESGLVISGTVEPVLGAALADFLVLPVETDDGEHWVVIDASDASVIPLDSLDVTRRVARVDVAALAVPADRVLTGLEGVEVLGLAALLLGAEACGVAGWCLDAAVGYAKVREQFGRPIGQFQGVKHKCARMLIAVEQARATVWDAARAICGPPGDEADYAVDAAAVVAPDAAVRSAADCIQVHGGIGYTWEHDAHLYYRRALTLRALLGRSAEWAASVADLAIAGVRRPVELDLPDDAEPLRERIRAGVAELAAMGQDERHAAMAAGGWVYPHLPKPWGRGASPLEQVLIHQEFRRADIRRPDLMIGAWVVPSLVAYGTPEQQERFLPGTLRGEIVWCQLFSEPGAGSDLAGLRTKASRVEGGWTLTGQKIWTSLAGDAHWAICLARTDPDAPKHHGISYFLVDMKSPGIEVRPLREMTGEAIFNEVFLDGVFVPDSQVVGEVHNGWRVARTTLANERVNLSTGWQLGADMSQLIELVTELGLTGDAVVRDTVGRLAGEEHAVALTAIRATLKQLSGTDPGATANVRKLLGMEHGQRVTEYGWTLLGAQGAILGTPSAPTPSAPTPSAGMPPDLTPGGRRHQLGRIWPRLLLASRAMTIGGGTTEVNLNVIGERILGLPRDPDSGK